MHVYDDITVVIPHISTRPRRLIKAISSVIAQNYSASDVIIAHDVRREGSAATRNRGLMKVTTPWVAFLDDDDELYPQHLGTLIKCARYTNADVIYPGCDVYNPALGGFINLQDEWGRFNKPFDADLLRKMSYIPVTSLVRTHLAQSALFGPVAGSDSVYDDWGFYVRLLDLGAAFVHVPVITWKWNHHGANTSGQADRW